MLTNGNVDVSAFVGSVVDVALLDEAAALRDENADLRRQLLAMRRLLRTTSELFLASQASASDIPLALDEPEEDSA